MTKSGAAQALSPFPYRIPAHSPAPFTLHDRVTGELLIEPSDGWSLRDAKDRVIAACSSQAKLQPGEKYANALLFGAAPALLYAAIEARRTAVADAGGDWVISGKAFQALGDALHAAGVR
jgi:hypothetical protein